MVHPEAQAALKKIVAKPVFPLGLTHLAAGTEIKITLDDRLEFALYFRDSIARIEERAAHHPDVEFALTSECVRVLMAHPGDNMAQFGIAVIEQVLQGEMTIRVVGSIWRILTGGYLKIITAAGPDFFNYLGRFGLQNAGKVIALIKQLKN